MADHRMRVSGYLTDAFDVTARQNIVKGIVGQLRKRRSEFDAIAVRGVSGVLIGSIVADRLKVPMLVVRKLEEKSHASYCVEGPLACRYVILDDLICSGTTVRKIQEDIKDSCDQSECVGIALYHRLNKGEAACHRDDFKVKFVVYQERGQWEIAKQDWTGFKWLTER